MGPKVSHDRKPKKKYPDTRIRPSKPPPQQPLLEHPFDCDCTTFGHDFGNHQITTAAERDQHEEWKRRQEEKRQQIHRSHRLDLELGRFPRADGEDTTEARPTPKSKPDRISASSNYYSVLQTYPLPKRTGRAQSPGPTSSLHSTGTHVASKAARPDGSSDQQAALSSGGNIDVRIRLDALEAEFHEKSLRKDEQIARDEELVRLMSRAECAESEPRARSTCNSQQFISTHSATVVPDIPRQLSTLQGQLSNNHKCNETSLTTSPAPSSVRSHGRRARKSKSHSAALGRTSIPSQSTPPNGTTANYPEEVPAQHDEISCQPNKTPEPESIPLPTITPSTTAPVISHIALPTLPPRAGPGDPRPSSSPSSSSSSESDRNPPPTPPPPTPTPTPTPTPPPPTPTPTPTPPPPTPTPTPTPPPPTAVDEQAEGLPDNDPFFDLDGWDYNDVNPNLVDLVENEPVHPPNGAEDQEEENAPPTIRDDEIPEDEIADILAELEEEIERRASPSQPPSDGDDVIQPRSFYRKQKKKKLSAKELETYSFGDIANRFHIARRGQDQLRDFTQTMAASTIRTFLSSYKHKLANGESITDEEINNIAASVLEDNQYKPGDGRAVYKMMQERTQFKSFRYDCCEDNCVSFAEYPDADICPNPKCGKSRWKDPDADVKVPVKTHVYFPIRHRLMLWYSSRYMSKLLTTYRRKAIASSLVRGGTRKLVDVWSGALYRAVRAKGFLSDPRSLAFCCGFDGTKAFKTRKDRYVWPIILTCLNLPPEIRFKRKNVLIVGFVPGPKNPGKLDTFLKPLADEFKYLTEVGIPDVWDAGSDVRSGPTTKGDTFTLKASILVVATDMQARKKVLRTMGLNSSSYCEFCQIKGLSYGGLHCPHKPPDNMPESVIEEQKKKMRQGRPCYNWERDYTLENSALRHDESYRRIAEYMASERAPDDPLSAQEFKVQKAKFAERTGITGKSVLMILPTLLFPLSFPPCTMHLYYENVAKSMFEHLAGRFFVNRPAPKEGEVESESDEDDTTADDEREGGRKRRGRKRKKGQSKKGGPKFKKRTGTMADFMDIGDPYNLPRQAWTEMGIDTKKSNRTYPDQLGEEMTNLTETFRRMKAANWQRFLFHQSPIYFKKYLPKYHYDNWMNMVEAMRLSTRKSLSHTEVIEIKERFFSFIAYYEKEYYRYDIDRISACLPTFHQLRHVHEAILNCGPTYAYAQWCMERINGSITAAIKSRTRPDENISTILELDIQASLMPFVIPGMDSALSKNAFSDKDGRLLLHKVFRHYIKTGELGMDEPEDANDDDEYGVKAPGFRNNKRWRGSPEVSSSILESLLTSDGHEFAMDKAQIEEEFGLVLADADIRRGMRKTGDVALVDRVKDDQSLPVLNSEQYKALRSYIKEYFGKGDPQIDVLFEWDGKSPNGKPLKQNRHHPGISFTKWKNVRFEHSTKMARYTIDTRAVRICGSTYDRSDRVRSASFFEFSTDTAINSGAHTAGNKAERASSQRSDHPREFAEALFFLSVDFDWDLIEQDIVWWDNEPRPKHFFLSYCHPLSVRKDDALTVINRQRGERKYKVPRWIDVDDMVDIVGLIHCRGDEFVCWTDACWDPVERKRLHPLEWRFTDKPDTGPERSDGVQPEEEDVGMDDARYQNPHDGEDKSVSDNIMRSWTLTSDVADVEMKDEEEYVPYCGSDDMYE